MTRIRTDPDDAATESALAIPARGRPHAAASTTRSGARGRRYAIVVVVLALLALGLTATMIMVGERFYSLDTVLAVLRGETVPGASFTLGTLRLPRAFTGLLVGIAFGMSGHVFQNLLRNTLASPDIVGITAGSSAAAVFGLLVLGISGTAVAGFAVVCGLAVALIISLLAAGRHGFGGRLILIGIGVSAMLNSVVSYLLMAGNTNDLPAALRWLSGSLNGASWDMMPALVITVLIAGAALLWLQRDLLPLELGDDAAAALGVRITPTRMGLILIAVGLISVATATTGPIAFVAFLSGPIALMLTGRSNRGMLIPAALTGACLVLGADLIGQFLLGVRLPVGVVTGLIGAPVFLLLLIRTHRTGATQ